jgi:hypothetical protein
MPCIMEKVTTTRPLTPLARLRTLRTGSIEGDGRLQQVFAMTSEVSEVIALCPRRLALLTSTRPLLAAGW